jgi:hypothetical protein
MVVAILGGLLDQALNHSLGVLFDVVFALVCVGAVSMVRRDGLFVTMAATPPMMVLVVVVSVLVGGPSAGDGLSSAAMGFGLPLLENFPTMGLTTVAVLIIGGLRALRHRRAPGPVRPGYPR